jgi:hypothetical protein
MIFYLLAMLAAVSAKWYGQAIKGQFSGTASRRVDWVNDTIKVALVKSAYTPNQDEHDFWNDVSANEITGTGYTAGGKALSEKTLTYDAASNTVRMDAKDVEWAESTLTARYAVIYKVEGSSAESPVLGYVDFGEDKSTSSGIFKIEWDATDGVLRDIVS